MSAAPGGGRPSAAGAAALRAELMEQQYRELLRQRDLLAEIGRSYDGIIQWLRREGAALREQNAGARRSLVSQLEALRR